MNNLSFRLKGIIRLPRSYRENRKKKRNCLDLLLRSYEAVSSNIWSVGINITYLKMWFVNMEINNGKKSYE